MTRKRPVFVKEESTSEEEYSDFDNYSNDENYDERNRKVSSAAKTASKKRKQQAESSDEKDTELEDDFDEKAYVTEPEVDTNDGSTTELDESSQSECETTDDEDSKEVVHNYNIIEKRSFDDSLPGNLEEGENFIVKIDKYWPYGMELDGTVPENRNLLYLYSIDRNMESGKCQFCNDENYQELSLRVRCSVEGHPDLEHSVEKFPEAFAKFMEKNEKISIYDSDIEYLLNPKCCSKTENVYIFDGINRSQLIKYFAYKSAIHVYLKVDPQSIPYIPSCIDKIIKSELKTKYCLPYLKQWEPIPLTAAYSDTFDFPEAEIPAGFKINLRSYQLRSISWMKEIESVKPSELNTISFNFMEPGKDECYIKVKLGDTPYYVEFNKSNAVTRSAKTVQMEPLRFYGGVLADDTGSGKTATTLGLIHASPLDVEKIQQRYARFDDINCLIQTGATLIVCPSNIYSQWIAEAKKMNPKFKICGFSTIYDHRKISIKDVMDADIVVVSYQFLMNANYYRNHKYSYLDPIYSHVRGCVSLHQFHYHRMILDEFHELALAANKGVPHRVKLFQADYVWGLTGTPNPKILSDLFDYSKTSLKISEKNSAELYYKHVKRNVPNLELPPIETETVWIDLSAHELALLRWKGRDCSPKAEIMMCSHYQLNEKETVAVNEFMSVENAEKKLSAKKSHEIDFLKGKLIGLHAQMEKVLKDNPDADVNDLQDKLKNVERKLASAQSNYNYFQNVFKVIGEPDKNECLICYDTIPAESLSILPCSHLYCYNCIKEVIEKSNECPLCRYPATPKEIFCIRIKKEETESVSASLGDIDTSKYSSKLIGLYRYITDLIKNDRNARIILFLQFSDLADFIGKSFNDFGINYVRVAGNVFKRQNAIAKFRESDKIRLIMMSSEDSVSGINLTQATHVILLHPFWTGSEAKDLAYEKQGISRAYRFGLDHPLKVVRFAVRGSIEEGITLRREKMNLSSN